jgi:signal transduction histidine kinase/CheY-like chemotaxis protein
MPEAVRTGTMTMSEVPVSNERHLLVQWSKAVTEDGRTHVIETITDVTERKRMEEAAHRTEKMEALSRLAGGTAHDINNLLTVIAGASELVSDGRVVAASGYDPIQQIRQAVSRAAELMRGLTAFSHSQLVRPAALDLNAALATVEPQVRSLCGPRVEVTVAAKEEGLRIVADPRQIEHILLVLARNACDAMPAGGHLTLCAAGELIGPHAAAERKLRPGRFARLDVRDTGCGIDSHVLEHLFEPYFLRAGRTGRGLGLASVYGMMRQCGGSIGVASERNVGTTFTLWFPCVEAEPALCASEPPSVPHEQSTILIVEDDDDVRLAVGDMLKRAGYQVQEASDGLDALQQLCSMAATPHLTITDVMMPRMSGPQLVRHLHSVMPAAKVLYMSGYAGEALEPVGEQPVAFIQKPFGARELLRKVREVIG